MSQEDVERLDEDEAAEGQDDESPDAEGHIHTSPGAHTDPGTRFEPGAHGAVARDADKS